MAFNYKAGSNPNPAANAARDLGKSVQYPKQSLDVQNKVHGKQKQQNDDFKDAQRVDGKPLLGADGQPVVNKVQLPPVATPPQTDPARQNLGLQTAVVAQNPNAKGPDGKRLAPSKSSEPQAKGSKASGGKAPTQAPTQAATTSTGQGPQVADKPKEPLEPQLMRSFSGLFMGAQGAKSEASELLQQNGFGADLRQALNKATDNKYAKELKDPKSANYEVAVQKALKDVDPGSAGKVVDQNLLLKLKQHMPEKYAVAYERGQQWLDSPGKKLEQMLSGESEPTGKFLTSEKPLAKQVHVALKEALTPSEYNKCMAQAETPEKGCEKAVELFMSVRQRPYSGEMDANVFDALRCHLPQEYHPVFSWTEMKVKVKEPVQVAQPTSLTSTAQAMPARLELLRPPDPKTLRLVSNRESPNEKSCVPVKQRPTRFSAFGTGFNPERLSIAV